MQDLNKALGDISSIRMQVARSTDFRGYGPATLAATGVLALAAATGQWRWLPDARQHFGIYLAVWIATAAVSAAVIGMEMYARTRRIHQGMADEMVRMAVEQFLPSVASGVFDDPCAGAVCVRSDVDAAGSLAGDFQPGCVFVLPVFAEADAGGGRVVPDDGGVLHFAGRRTRVFALGDGDSLRRGTTAGGGSSGLRIAGGER